MDKCKSVSARLCCALCGRGFDIEPSQVEDCLEILPDMGWLVVDSSDGTTDLFCPSCSPWAERLSRLSEHSRIVPGLDGTFLALDTGDICEFYGKRSWDGERWVPWRCVLLPTCVDQGGYIRVSVREDGSIVQRPAHRLVAEAWLGEGGELPIVDHINRRRYDNRPENLRWASYEQNNANRDYTRPLVAIGDNGSVVEFKSVTAAQQFSRRAMMSANRDWFDFSDGFVFVYKDEYDDIEPGPYIEQMLEAGSKKEVARMRYFDWLGVSKSRRGASDA
ncbi:HNH endonuclease signature motif containing protein [Adlercreutzia sp. R25]|uniref:HNH endonuclease signature motif containing protein n=1 Tax=Adlercreutzia shanghongiae TaxID=3111773 RepID=UPI002DB7EA15|nr:HNH endonuclease signature motif containing protein [Adlercreutzia sp. R25]MEC4272949.1 HNH endonuclease signature motif containing protein [Adlercreutzia sp. R25]